MFLSFSALKYTKSAGILWAFKGWNGESDVGIRHEAGNEVILETVGDSGPGGIETRLLEQDRTAGDAKGTLSQGLIQDPQTIWEHHAPPCRGLQGDPSRWPWKRTLSSWGLGKCRGSRKATRGTVGLGSG